MIFHSLRCPSFQRLLIPLQPAWIHSLIISSAKLSYLEQNILSYLECPNVICVSIIDFINIRTCLLLNFHTHSGIHNVSEYILLQRYSVIFLVSSVLLWEPNWYRTLLSQSLAIHLPKNSNHASILISLLLTGMINW